MKNNKRTFIIIGVVIFILHLLLGLYILKSQYDDMAKRNEPLLEMLKKSEILKNEIGKIKSIDVKLNIYLRKYKKLDSNSEYVNYTLKTYDNKKHKVKIIYNKKYTFGIYAYEINGRVFYEDVEKVQPKIEYVNYIYTSSLLKEKFGNIKTVNKTNTSSNFIKYDEDGSEACDHYIELENNKIIYLTVILNKKYTEGVYAYIIDGQLIYENLGNNGLDFGIDYMNHIMYSKTLRELLGDYSYMYELELSKKEEKDNKIIIDFILIKDENNSKKISVIFNSDYSIYAYIIDKEIVYEE